MATISKVCDMCGMPFEAHRSDARFCSGRCRTEYCRATKMVGNLPVATADLKTPKQAIQDAHDCATNLHAVADLNAGVASIKLGRIAAALDRALEAERL